MDYNRVYNGEVIVVSLFAIVWHWLRDFANTSGGYFIQSSGNSFTPPPPRFGHLTWK